MKFIEKFLQPHSSIKNNIERVKSSFLSTIILVIWILFLGMSLAHFFSPSLKIPAIPLIGAVTIPTAYLLNKLGKYKISAYLLIFLFIGIHILDTLISTSPPIAQNIYLVSAGIILSAMLLELSDTIIITLINLTLILLIPHLPARQPIHYRCILHPLIFNLLISILVILFAEFNKRYHTLNQRNLEENYERFRILFDNMPIALWEYDGTELIKYFSELKKKGIANPKEYLEKNPKELEKSYTLLKVREVNQRAVELYRFKDKEDFINNINKLFKRHNVEEFKESMIPFLNGGTSDEREHRHYTVDGKELIVLRKVFVPQKYKENWKHIMVAVVDITSFRKLQYKLQERANFLQLVLKVAKDINKELDIEKLFLNTVKTISSTLGFYNCSIWMLEDNFLVLKAFSFAQTSDKPGERVGLVNERYPIEGIIGWAITDNEIKYVKDTSKDPHYVTHYSEIKTKSECTIPLRDKGRVIGALDIQSDRVDAFSRADIEVFSSVADQISVAIRNAMSYNEALKRTVRLEAVNNIARIVNTTLDTDTVIEKAYMTIKEIFKFDAFYLALYDDENDTIDYKIVEDRGTRLKWNKIKLSKLNNSASYVIREKKIINLKDVPQFIQEHVSNDKQIYIHGEIPKKLLAVPLRTEDKIIGVISVQSYGEKDFNSEDELFLSIIADQIATALKNANLYNSLQQELIKRKKLEHQLLQSQKLEAIGKLAGGVAHEFNNLLTAIIGNVDLLLLTPGNEESAMELMEIRNAAERAARLTGQLLAFGKKQLMEIEKLDINEQIMEMKETLLALLGKNIEVKFELTNKNTTVRSNRTQLSRALINIVTNAKESMPAGGSLTVKTDIVVIDEDTIEAVTPLTPGRYVTIKIIDTGVGIEENILPRIFDPFFTTKKFGEGPGLGLSIAYGIIKQFGGDITASSTPGRGTTITIYLPAAKN